MPALVQALTPRRRPASPSQPRGSGPWSRRGRSRPAPRRAAPAVPRTRPAGPGPQGSWSGRCRPAAAARRSCWRRRRGSRRAAWRRRRTRPASCRRPATGSAHTSSSAPGDSACEASPKLATSMPRHLSLVDRSAPSKVPPRRRAAGRRRPRPSRSRARPGPSSDRRPRRTRRSRRRPGDAGAAGASTTTPPRSPIASPADRASSSRGPDAGGEHDQVDVERVTLGERHPQVAVDLFDHLRRGAQPDVHPESLDQPAERLAAALVDLHRHQPRCELDHRRASPSALQGVGGLETEQPAADDRTAAARLRHRADRLRGRPASGRRTGRDRWRRAPGARTASSRSRAPRRRTASRPRWRSSPGGRGCRSPRPGRPGAGPDGVVHRGQAEAGTSANQVDSATRS